MEFRKNNRAPGKGQGKNPAGWRLDLRPKKQKPPQNRRGGFCPSFPEKSTAIFTFAAAWFRRRGGSRGAGRSRMTETAGFGAGDGAFGMAAVTAGVDRRDGIGKAAVATVAALAAAAADPQVMAGFAVTGQSQMGAVVEADLWLTGAAQRQGRGAVFGQDDPGGKQQKQGEQQWQNVLHFPSPREVGRVIPPRRTLDNDYLSSESLRATIIFSGARFSLAEIL
jgi:hypothetical protein